MQVLYFSNKTAVLFYPLPITLSVNIHPGEHQPKQFPWEHLKNQAQLIHTNLFLAAKSFVLRVVFPVVSEGWPCQMCQGSGLVQPQLELELGCSRQGWGGGSGAEQVLSSFCWVHVSLTQNPPQWSMEFKIWFSRRPNWIRGIVLKICWLWNV